MSREALMTKTFVELADTLVDEFDVGELLNLLIGRCIEVLNVDGAAGLLLLAPAGALRVMSSSSEAMRVLELFELQEQEGPCLDCFQTGEQVVNQDLAASNGRWPKFSVVAMDAGFKAVHAFPMKLRGSCIGALNLFHVVAGDMSPSDVATAQAFADVATIAILQYRSTLEAQAINGQLASLFEDRAVVEQAKGVVAEREGMSMAEAYNALRNYALANNLKLNNVCIDIIERSLSTWALLVPATLPEGQGSLA